MKYIKMLIIFILGGVIIIYFFKHFCIFYSYLCFSFIYFSFSAIPMAYGSSWARDGIGARAVTFSTAAAMPDPDP